MAGAHTRPLLHYGYVVLVMSSLALLGAWGFGRLIYTLILPSMKAHLGLSYTETGLIATSNLVGYLVFVPLAGFLATKYGSRLITGASTLGVGLMVLLSGLSNGFATLAPLQFLAGAAGGGAIVPGIGVLSAWFAPRKRGMALGTMSVGVGLGFFISGPLVPRIIATYGPNGWRYAWFLFGGLVMSMGIVIYLFLRDRPQEKGLLPVGQTSEPGPADSVPSHLSWASVYRARAVWHLSALYGIFGFAYVNYATFFAAYLQQEGGLDAATVGSVWAISGFGLIIGGVGWGLLSDWLGRKTTLIMVFLLLGASIYLLTIPGLAGLYYLSALLFWTVEPGGPVIVGAALGDAVGGRMAPAAMGLASLFMGLGQALGPFAGGFLADSTHSFQIVFYTSALASLAGALGTIPLKAVAGKL